MELDCSALSAQSRHPLRRRSLQKLRVRALQLLFLGASLSLYPTLGWTDVAPLNRVAVPDVNQLGILDRTGPRADGWPQITKAGNKVALQQAGKALFWDMQVGGDGVTACGSCHYHAGADHRRTNQLSPGLKAGDFEHDLLDGGPNASLTSEHFGFFNANDRPVGLPVSETELMAQGWGADAADGTAGIRGSKGNSNLDVNDVVSSQGVRAGEFRGVSPGRVDYAVLIEPDSGFDYHFTWPAVGIPNTVRRVEPRNAPSVVNAVFNFRNFADGRADAFFNGVNPLGFRDPSARVKVFVDGQLGAEKLRIPFSSLASQSVGPPLNGFEMQFDPRTFADIGKKMARAEPLSGQNVACDDSLLGELACGTETGVQRGLADKNYGDMLKAIFDERFWGDGEGENVCLKVVADDVTVVDCSAEHDYTLFEWNFALFFGLAVQAYEATLVTEQTIVDLVRGGIATGQLQNGTGRKQRTVNVAGLPLSDCIARLALNKSAAAQGVAQNLCTAHYAKFIHVGAMSGSESNTARFPVPANSPIGGCANPPDCVVPAPQLARAQNTLLNVDRGINRFFSGATACGVCHHNPEFTGATISALTGFGAATPPPLPPGQLRREALEAPVERMIAFNGLPAVYDAGFYNIGVRPSSDDVALGDEIGGVPLSFARLKQILAAGSVDDWNLSIDAIGAELADAQNGLKIPTSPTDLTPKSFDLKLACGPGLVGAQPNPGGPNNNPNTNCAADVLPDERLQRNGAFKAPGIRNVKFTGPYFHNGSKKNLRQMLEFYKTAGHFPNLNGNNLDAGMRIFDLGVAEESSLIEMMETGLTDWRLAYDQGKFDHPEICVPHGHDPVTGRSILVGIPAVGIRGHVDPLQTFEEQLEGVTGRAHTLTDACTVPDIHEDGLSTIDVPPAL
jgi:cytochrome c peroxidase